MILRGVFGELAQSALALAFLRLLLLFHFSFHVAKWGFFAIAMAMAMCAVAPVADATMYAPWGMADSTAATSATAVVTDPTSRCAWATARAAC